MDYNTLIIIERNGKEISFYLGGNGTLKIENIVDVDIAMKSDKKLPKAQMKEDGKIVFED